MRSSLKHSSPRHTPKSRRRDAPTNVASTIVGTSIDERAVAESFADAVSGYDASQLARAANRNKETARQWKNAEKAPNSASLINMARKIPAVDAWLRHQIGRYEEMEFDSPQRIGAIVAAAIRELEK